MDEFNDWLDKNRWPVTLAAVAFAVRAVYFLTVAGDPFFTQLRIVTDSFFFDKWAHEIAAGDWLGGKDVFFIGPLYAYFLGIIYRVAGPSLALVRFAHIALDVGSVLFLYGFTRRALGERAAKVAGVIWTFYLPAIFFGSFVLPVSLDIFLITASFYFLARGEEGRWWNFAAAGLLLGLAVLDRTNLLAFVVAAVPLFLIYIKRLKWRRAAAYFAPIVLLVLAATLRNGLVAGDYVVVSSQGGINFYLGNSAEATGAYWHLASTSESNPAALNRDAATSIAEGALGRPLRPSEVQRWFFGQGSAWLRGHPGDAGRLYWRKFRMLTNDYEIGLNADFYFRRFSSFYHRAPWPWFGFVFAFGVIGLVVGWRKAAFARKAGALFVVAYALSVLLFFVSARYRMPMVPLLVAFAGAGLAYWYDLWRRRRRRSAALLTAAVLALGAFSIKGVEGARFDTGFGQAYYRLGKYYFDEGKRREAIFNLERAAATTPAFFDAYFMLGVAYEESGQAEDSLDAFRRSTLAAPNRAETHFNYGVALIRAGRSEEALAPFRRTVELDPGFAPAWVQIGEVYITLDDYVNAERAYGRAVRAQPGEPRAMGRYAEVLMKLGDYAAALRWAEAASRADPNMPGPGLTAGRIYFQYRKYAAARAYLEPEAELQPTNAEVFGLLAASCAKLGDDEAAARSYQTYTDLGGSAAPDFERDAGLPPR